MFIKLNGAGEMTVKVMVLQSWVTSTETVADSGISGAIRRLSPRQRTRVLVDEDELKTTNPIHRCR